ncbi:TetR/AcrR family transcriptional regulator [Streptomyces sp. NPDC059816]|uniref:TetR/AcrR family transcriptional regulator n=1 Tax=Streptomyces sp. NPDC059816 TaxID=3346960 RepID=UPI0036486C81
MAQQSSPEERGRYGRRHPRPGLTTASVVAAGRQLIERDGLDALTMRAVARELGTAATSLYRHVADRDALLLLILEQIAEGLPVEVPGGTAHERLLGRLVTAHDYLAGHVWVLHILIRGDLVAETAFSFVDACFADFLEAGLSPEEASACAPWTRRTTADCRRSPGYDERRSRPPRRAVPPRTCSAGRSAGCWTRSCAPTTEEPSTRLTPAARRSPRRGGPGGTRESAPDAHYSCRCSVNNRGR